jgi:hypothetical protein
VTEPSDIEVIEQKNREEAVSKALVDRVLANAKQRARISMGRPGRRRSRQERHSAHIAAMRERRNSELNRTNPNKPEPPAPVLRDGKPHWADVLMQYTRRDEELKEKA